MSRTTRARAAQRTGAAVREQAQRPERAERQRVSRALQPAVQQPAVQQVQTEHRSWDRRRSGMAPRARPARRAANVRRRRTPSVQVQSEQQQRQYRGTDRRSDRSIMGQVLEQNRERQGQVAVAATATATAATSRAIREANRQWSNHWRNDRNYDWRHYRDRNRSVYRLGNYYDPYRYGYRRFSIGFSLFPSYYQSSYWLNDPWMYRLPPAYGPYRWVRYYDDALLVNIYTGQVVDVVYSFFW
jgi:Ni/Co efflux regulator RcnB